MHKMKMLFSIPIMFVLLCTGVVLAANDGGPSSQLTDSEAKAVLMKMADFISKAKSFSVTVESGYDAVQEDGQKIEFGSVRKVLIDRPNRAREDVQQRDGTKAEFIFNGKEIYFFNAKSNVYGTVEKQGSLDEAVDYFTEALGMRLPLSEIYSADLLKYLSENIRILDYVDMAIIDGVKCDHLAARMDNVDFQVWIQQGAKPLLHRIIITYKNALGQPQYWAQFRDWNFSPDMSQSLFAFQPPEGAEKISFVALMPKKPNPGKQKGDSQ